MTEFKSSDEHISVDLDHWFWLNCHNDDPQFEILQSKLVKEDQGRTHTCQVCGCKVTDLEFDINGCCPGCGSPMDELDVPF